MTLHDDVFHVLHELRRTLCRRHRRAVQNETRQLTQRRRFGLVIKIPVRKRHIQILRARRAKWGHPDPTQHNDPVPVHVNVGLATLSHVQHDLQHQLHINNVRRSDDTPVRQLQPQCASLIMRARTPRKSRA